MILCVVLNWLNLGLVDLVVVLGSLYGFLVFDYGIVFGFCVFYFGLVIMV